MDIQTLGGYVESAEGLVFRNDSCYQRTGRHQQEAVR